MTLSASLLQTLHLPHLPDPGNPWLQALHLRLLDQRRLKAQKSRDVRKRDRAKEHETRNEKE